MKTMAHAYLLYFQGSHKNKDAKQKQAFILERMKKK
jgi:hypothetical protein